MTPVRDSPQNPAFIDPARCPLCGGDNACGAASGAGTCWCFAARISPDVLERVPPELRDKACICEKCASGRIGSAEAQAIIENLNRRG